MTDYVGQQLGNYRLIRLLGKGSFAEVYLGEHIHLSTQAAIKVLHTQLTSDDVDNFRNEARIIARLIHPHIVRVIEFGVEGKTPFLVMDYAPHGTLRQRHPKGTGLPLDTVVSYVKQLADALQYAHEKSWFTGISSRRICCWCVSTRFYSVTLALRSSPRVRTPNRYRIRLEL
jgi:eukaryotic-like serine/threonine-protein kinase